MATTKTYAKSVNQVIPITATERDSLGEAVNQFLLWEMRSRDCIKVKRCYIDVATDLEAGVLLSQIIYWHLPDKEGEQKLTVQRDGHWWLAKAREDWWDECRLTPKQFDRAIRHLEAKQLVVTKVYKWHSTNTKHIRVDWAGLLQALSMLDANAEKVVGFRRRQPVTSVGKVQSNKSQALFSELPNSQSCGLPNSQSLNSLIGNSQLPKQSTSELPIRQLHLYTEITSDITNKDYYSPLTPQGEQGCVEQLAICFTSTAEGDRWLDESPQLEKLPGKEVSPDLPDVPPQSEPVENVAATVGYNSPFSPLPELNQLEKQTLPTAEPDSIKPPIVSATPEVVHPLVEVVDSSKAIAYQEQPLSQQYSRNRFRRNQQQLPKNIDGSDRLPWETERRGKFDPEFEKWMARSFMQYPAFQKLMAGELQIKVRKHISAGKYDFKRQDELFIEWEAMQSGADMGEQSYGITARAVSRRAKIRSALCS